MAWHDLPKTFRELAERVCTPAELEVLRLMADGLGLKRIARARGCTTGTVKVLRNRAEAKIRAEIDRVRTEGLSAGPHSG